jgi:phenylacetate-CoA ligase
MTVVVERREATLVEGASDAGRHLERLVKNSIGVSVAVRVVEPASIERSVGKMRRIVDKRPAR